MDRIADIEATRPELFHYSKWMNALLWGCAHDRVELRHIETGAPARARTAAGVYECGNGHIYERRDDASWTVVTVGVEVAA